MNVSVNTAQGELRGSFAGGVHAFLGVPHAAPPFGGNRLRPPQPARRWSGLRDATEFAPEPPQVAPPATGGPDTGAAEDWEDVTSAFAAVKRAAPRAEGLFRRAILQSGAAHQVTPAGDALRISGYLAGKLGVPATRDAIAGAGVPRLLAAQAELKDELLSDPDPGRWGEAVVASVMPWQPVIAGTNIEDWRLWLVASGAIARITDEILTGPVRASGHQALAAYGLPADARFRPTGSTTRRRPPGSCSRRFRLTGGCGSPRSA
ncbi:carboxylesterase family protein [Micrococcaceae bacterium Sec7.4]